MNELYISHVTKGDTNRLTAKRYKKGISYAKKAMQDLQFTKHWKMVVLEQINILSVTDAVEEILVPQKIIDLYSNKLSSNFLRPYTFIYSLLVWSKQLKHPIPIVGVEKLYSEVFGTTLNPSYARMISNKEGLKFSRKPYFPHLKKSLVAPENNVVELLKTIQSIGESVPATETGSYEQTPVQKSLPFEDVDTYFKEENTTPATECVDTLINELSSEISIRETKKPIVELVTEEPPVHPSYVDIEGRLEEMMGFFFDRGYYEDFLKAKQMAGTYDDAENSEAEKDLMLGYSLLRTKGLLYSYTVFSCREVVPF